ncbi:ADAMTS-like protein 5 isoform 2-T2 [Porphyrio hochstetteri]
MVPGAGGRCCCSWPGSAWAAASPPRRARPWGQQRGSLSPQPPLGPAGSRPGVLGVPGDPGAPAPAPVGTASRSAPGGACGPPRRTRVQVTRGSTGSASSRAVPAAQCPSAPCSAPSMTTSPSWARQPGTAGCPSMESVGCDGILGSGTQPDACGQCGGGHDTCFFVHRLFQGTDPSSGSFGYMNVTKIPAGATHIKVTDKSRNYLALMTSDGRYVLNGDWSIAWPGPYEVAGTWLRYSRAPDGTESLEGSGPTNEDLHVMVLLQEPNPGIEYEFWLPRGHPQLGRGDTSPLRQPQTRGAGSPPPQEPLVTLAPVLPPQPRGSAMEPPPRSPPGRSGARAAAGRCGRCRPAKGRSQRIWHFCQSDFVFRGRILARRLVGQETRYEVEVKTPYRHRFPLVPREYLWVPNTCGCPPLREGDEYLLMARRHVNYEHTLNRILLQGDGYARPWTLREHRLVQEAARRCPQPSLP